MSFLLSELASAFNKKSFENMLHGDFTHLKKMDAYFFDNKSITLGEFYDKSYKLLSRKYKNEYVFKNTIARKIVIGKHKLANVSVFSEFKIWNKYVDLLVVNETTTAYEIKTEFDSYSRLKDQLLVYVKAFEYVNLVIPQHKFSSDLVAKIPSTVGVLTLTDRNTLYQERVAISNKKNLSAEMIFSCMRKNEYINIIEDRFGELPSVKNLYMRSACLDAFTKLSTDELATYFRDTLKQRNPLVEYRDYLKQVPYSMHCMFLCEKSKNVEKIIDMANTQLY